MWGTKVRWAGPRIEAHVQLNSPPKAPAQWKPLPHRAAHLLTAPLLLSLAPALSMRT